MNLAIFNTRRENLRKLILDKYQGNRAAFARAAGVHQNQINLLLSSNEDHRRNLGEALARKMEETVGLPTGYFDRVTSGKGEAAFTLYSLTEIPEHLRQIIRPEDVVHSLSMYERGFEGVEERITGKENLRLSRVVSSDLSPILSPDDQVVVDAGVKAVSADGIYILQRGQDAFLRRVTRQLTGGWNISSNNESVHVDSLKGMKAAARVVMAIKVVVL